MKDFNINQTELIFKLMDVMVDAVNYEELAKRIVDKFSKLFEANLCTLWRVISEDSKDILEMSAGIGIEKKPGDIIPKYILNWDAASNDKMQGITPWIAIKRKVCLANSYDEVKNDKTKPWYKAHRGRWDSFLYKGEARKNFKCLLGLPILYNNHDKEEIIGVLKVENTRKNSGFSQKDKALALRLIPFVAIALKTMVVRENHEQKRQQILRSLTGALLTQDQTAFYQELVNKTAELLDADVCSLWLVNKERNRLTLGANFGVKEKRYVPEYPLIWDVKDDNEIEGLTPWVAIRRRSFYADKHEDLRDHHAWKGKWDKVQWEGRAPSEFGCLYAVPLIDVKDMVFGVLKIENRRDKSKFGAVDKATFDLMADFIALAIELNSRLRSDIIFEFFHLLKQPIANAIMAFSNLRDGLLQSEPRRERIESRLEMLSKNLDVVHIWIKNVYGLAASRDIHGEGVSEISIHKIFSDVIKEMKKLFQKFTCNLDKLEKFTLLLTPLQMKKVDAILFNLLDNSFKYSNDPRNIWVEAYKDMKGINIFINDNGIGIAPKDLPRVFDPYFTRSAKQWPTSMGLGLATVDRLIKELGWDRKIESKSKKGTRFSIFIPKEVLK